MNCPKSIQIFLLLLVISAAVLFAGGCLSSAGSKENSSVETKSFAPDETMKKYFFLPSGSKENYSVDMKPFKSEEEMKIYFSLFYRSAGNPEWEYSQKYSGSIWPSMPGVYYETTANTAAPIQIALSTGSRDSASSPPVLQAPSNEDISSAFVSRYSETNVQTAGVDEADSVKTDGKTIYYTPDNYYPYEVTEKKDSWRDRIYYSYHSEKKTFVIDALPPADASILSQINMSGDLYLINNTLVTIHYNLVTGYDVTDPSSPEEIWEKQLWGYYVDSRVVDGKLYLVVQNQTVLFPMTYMDKEVSYKDIYYPAGTDLIQSEAQNIYYVSEVDVKSGDFNKTIALLGSGNSIFYGSDQYLYLTHNYRIDESILYLDFIKEYGPGFYPLDVMKKVETIFKYEYIDSYTKAQTVRGVIYEYSSSLDAKKQTELYNKVQDAYTVYAQDISKSAERTGISRIDLKTFELKTGSVSGYIINPFSINEYDGNLRVATTRSSNWMSRDYMSSSVHVLDQNMNVIGSLQGLAPDEEIYSSRFVGNKLYLVTFRIIDPFFVIDLSDPKKPAVLGELKIPGYSTYLHPINETAVIGLGRADNGSMKLTLFDVTNFSNPVEMDSYVFDRYVYSAADHDYHAFMWDADKDLLVIPTYGHAFIFSVKGGQISLDLDDVHAEAMVSRTIYINDYFYTFSNREVHILDQNTWKCVKVVGIPQPEFKNELKIRVMIRTTI